MNAAKATNTTMPFDDVQARDTHNATDTMSDDMSFGSVHITPSPSHSRSSAHTQSDASFDFCRAIVDFENFPQTVSTNLQGTVDTRPSFHIDQTQTKPFHFGMTRRRKAVSADVVLVDRADVERTSELDVVVSFGAFLPKHAGAFVRRRRRA